MSTPMVPNRGAVVPWGATDTFQRCYKNLNILILQFLLLLECVYNWLVPRHIIHFAAMMLYKSIQVYQVFSWENCDDGQHDRGATQYCTYLLYNTGIQSIKNYLFLKLDHALHMEYIYVKVGRKCFFF
jgi:hypothetical protein